MTSSTSKMTSDHPSSFVFAAGVALGVVAMTCWERARKHRLWDSSSRPARELPEFAHQLEDDPNLHKMILREWQDLTWRRNNGWKGNDLCHNPHGKAVRVLDYFVNESNTEMTGIVWFGPEAESHRGLCHGGAMSSLMDDFCGHMAFLDKPWSGATVQVNVSLKRPVPIGSILRIHGRISKREGRKIHVEAVLDDGNSKKAAVYATLEGLSIDGVQLTDHNDEVADRTWEVHSCQKSGRKQRRDSGWKMNGKTL